MLEDYHGILVIVAIALATYGTRIGGYLVLSRFGRLDPRVEAGLDAVPAAVLAALAAPLALTEGWAELIASAVTLACAFRIGMPSTLVIAVATLVALRGIGL